MRLWRNRETSYAPGRNRTCGKFPPEVPKNLKLGQIRRTAGIVTQKEWSTLNRDERDAVVIPLDVTAHGAGSGAPVDQSYWLGARVRADKIIFFGFFRTESDAVDAGT